jgi:hypothetical protein
MTPKQDQDWRCTRQMPNPVAHLVKSTEGDKVRFACTDWQQAIHLTRNIKGAKKCSYCLAEGEKK